MCVVRLYHTIIHQLYSLPLQIRIGGYKAIVRMSEEQPRWLERNVDVLVQLLQSGAFPRLMLRLLCSCRFSLHTDEPEELAVVKTALIQHLEFDSRVSLVVLCDQIVTPDDPMEDEDKPSANGSARSSLLFSPRTHDSPSSQCSRARRGANRHAHQGVPRFPQPLPYLLTRPCRRYSNPARRTQRR